MTGLPGGRFSADARNASGSTSAAALRGSQVERVRFGRDPIVELPEGRIALPGLKDLHTHPVLWSVIKGIQVIDISDCRNVDEIVTKLRSYRGEGRKIIAADGLNTTLIPKITAKELDGVSTEVPVFIFDPSYHGGFLNTKAAREFSEAARNYGDSLPGYINPDGEWKEQLYVCIEIAARTIGEERLTKMVLDWVFGELKKGTTEIHELDIGDLFSLRALTNAAKVWYEKTAKLRTLDSDRPLPFPVTRVYGPPWLITGLKSESDLRESVDRYFGGLGIKLYADGSFGSHTACIRRPYNDGHGFGMIVDNGERVRRFIGLIGKTNIPGVAVHAIGDHGIERAFDIAVVFHREMGIGVRIEHFELSGNAELLARTRMLVDDRTLEGVSIQPNFISDIGAYEDRLGAERVSEINPIATLVKLGIPFNFGTDGMPQSMLSAVSDSLLHPVPEQRISLDQALRIATSAAPMWLRSNELVSTSWMVAEKSLMDDLRHGSKTDIGKGGLERRVIEVIYYGYSISELQQELEAGS